MADRPENYTFDHGTAKGYGVSYGEGPDSYGHDIITIQAGESYPAEGYWASSSESEINVVVVRGRGGVAIRGVAYLKLDATAPVVARKMSVRMDPGQKYRWNAEDGEDLVISMLTSPKFNEAKYSVTAEDEIVDPVSSDVTLNTVEIDVRGLQRAEGIHGIIEHHLTHSDADHLAGITNEHDAVGYVMDRLVEQGEDPFVILAEAGITVRNENEV